VQAASGVIGDRAAVGGRPRVERRPGDRMRRDHTGRHVDGVQPPSQRERGDGAVGIDGVADDPIGLFTGALSTRTLLGRERAAVGRQGARVDEPFGPTGGGIVAPQVGDGIIAGIGAQEQHERAGPG
jgi:hypothetical protein